MPATAVAPRKKNRTRTRKSSARKSASSSHKSASSRASTAHVAPAPAALDLPTSTRNLKMVYSFGNKKAEGLGSQRELLGGKGAGLAEMTRIGLPVPAGFTITTQACALYYQNKKHWPQGLEKQIRANLAKLEKTTRKKLGSDKNPLLVSVRSGAARSMPGMMETILNLGLTDKSVLALANITKNPRFAWDSYRRFIQMYSTVVTGLSKDLLESKLHHLKKSLNITNDTDIPAEHLQHLCDEFKAFFREQTGSDFPQNPWDQLTGAINAVFSSWMAEKALTYRRVEKIDGLLGTAVNVQAMVFGNTGDDSGTGVCFTRDPSTGENTFYGDLLINAQGEDVVAGIRTPIHLHELATKMPDVWDQLNAVRVILESHYKDMQDLEFTIEHNKLYMLQCRTGKRTPAAAFRIAVEQATKPILTRAQATRLARKRMLSKKDAKSATQPVITKDDAILRITSADIERLFYPIIDPAIPAEQLSQNKLATGINAVPGAACGQIVFTAADAEKFAGQGYKVVLVRKETSPEDVGGMHAAVGILTATGGKTSHAAVVARGWGKCCIVGCGSLDIDYDAKRMMVAGRVLNQGEWLTLDGSEGLIYGGQLPLVQPQLPPEYHTLMAWADKRRTLGVRTNADTPYDARNAITMGAQGIGLCRTEHMFFDTEERRLAMQRMILADTREQRIQALDALLPFQREDFVGIFEAMNGYPVTIRLIDPPLHEFVPHEFSKQQELANRIGVPVEKVQQRVEQLHEANPMLGHRGCRLCITYPEILDMQVRAIMEAAADVKQRGIEVHPEIMIPLSIDKKELGLLVKQTRAVADTVLAEAGMKLPYLVGTMIETPRAALLADQIAQVSEFFSFGTNDLTQMVMGLSRDDAGRFLPEYVDKTKANIFREDPFQSLDQAGVGLLMKWAIEKGREGAKHRDPAALGLDASHSRKSSAKSSASKSAHEGGLKIGICGEHGGESASVQFCHALGMDYVSCSPYRVPIARLAAAQAAIG
ncbi:MAG TPA: putative PEP-binding protein [Phycisphaerales bacterium]|nr:putative PEP-binding protein [Phycisphaerales bacterium]